MELEKEATISLVSVNDENLMQLKNLNVVLFPNRFDQQFYDQALALASRDFNKLALYGDYCVGTILCDLEKKDDGVSRVHIMTLGVLACYRRKGIGTKLMNHVLDRCSKENVSEIYLHIHTDNEDAINFYKKFGFEMTETIKNYYKNTPSPDSYKFTKIIAASLTKKQPFSELNTTEEILGTCSDTGDSSHRRKKVEEEASISLVSVTDENLMELQNVSDLIFPYLIGDDNHYADSLASGDFTKLARCGDEYVGAIECQLEKKADGTVRRVYVKNLGVLKPYRRRGIGTKLMNHVLDCCSKENVPEVYLHVSIANENAINFYKKFGFEKTGTDGFSLRIHKEITLPSRQTT